MPYRFKSSDLVPRGGWKFFERRSRYWVSADNFEELVRRVNRHRAWKKYSQANTEADIVKQLCQRHGPGFCREYEEYYPDKTDTATSEKLLNFNKTAFNFLKSGGQTVSVEEAQDRAEICRGCPFNVAASNCSCSLFYKALEALIPPSRRIPGLKVCSVCGCSLQAKVRVPLGAVENGDTEFPDWCWQRTS